jgi:hypothetical protein
MIIYEDGLQLTGKNLMRIDRDTFILIATRERPLQRRSPLLMARQRRRKTAAVVVSEVSEPVSSFPHLTNELSLCLKSHPCCTQNLIDLTN